VIGFLAGELGTPPGGWPEPLRSKALAGREVPVRMSELTAEQEAGLTGQDVRRTLDELLFPGPAREYEEAVRAYGDLAPIPTRPFFYGLVPGEEIAVSLGRGLDLFVELEAVGDADERGKRTVLCKLNGALRAVTVRDRSIETSEHGGERADPADPGHVAAPFSGVVALTVKAGDTVVAGQAVATIEAMKMEANITTNQPGIVERVAVASVASVEPGDLLLVVRPAPTKD
jgi:pyruvate carboxylase